jgi:hypothetical protein
MLRGRSVLVGAAVSGAVARASGADKVQLSAELLSGEIVPLDAMQKNGAVGWLVSALERRREDGLGDAVCTACRGVQLSLRLNGDCGLCLYVGGQPARLDAAQEVDRHFRSEAPEVPQELGDGLRLPMSSSVRSWRAPWSLWRRQAVQLLGPQFCVGLFLRRRGDDVLHPCGASVVRLRDYVTKFHLSSLMAAQENWAWAWANYTASRSAHNGETTRSFWILPQLVASRSLPPSRRGHQWICRPWKGAVS